MGTKRPSDDERTFGKKKPASPWALGLLESMKDPKLFVEDDEHVVVIRDKYPKAEYHYLVLPKEDIPTMDRLTNSHLNLLKHIQEVGERLASVNSQRTFKLGYHAVPSMSHIHLHVISDDFNSPWLKTKKHWNSFTTEYFVPSESVISQVEKYKKFAPASKEKSKLLLEKPLACHKCSFLPGNMPKLKSHLLTHLKK
ncbi:aprataxin [Bacillus rossius redtenbacheri]|uniref:aprataxin n=1 Tax=Bacillus rossius redtenbacheri TaxID=93214 RepID=UPI002FDD8826